MQYIRHTLALSLLVLLSACRTAQLPPPLFGTFSGIPKALFEDSWFPSDSDYQLVIHLHDKDFDPTFNGGETIQRRMVVRFSSGNRGDFVHKCHDGVMKLLASVGAEVRDRNYTHSDRYGMRDFYADYKWRDNGGMIRVYSEDTGEQEVTLILFCNEHKR